MGDKATNKAMTMAFKNVLNQAFAISTAETVDSDGQMPEETVQRPASSGAAHRPTAAAAPASSSAGEATFSAAPADPHGLQESRGDTGAYPAATDKQQAMVKRLEKKLGVSPLTDTTTLTKSGASTLIEELLAMESGLASAPGGADLDADIPFAPVQF